MGSLMGEDGREFWLKSLGNDNEAASLVAAVMSSSSTTKLGRYA